MNKVYVFTLRDPYGRVIINHEFVTEYISDKWEEYHYPLPFENAALPYTAEIRRR